MSEEHRIPVEEALERLDVIEYDPGDGSGPCVHTYRDAGVGLLGAHWKLDRLRALMEQHGVEEAGDMAAEMRHGLVVIDDTGPLFLATKPTAE